MTPRAMPLAVAALLLGSTPAAGTEAAAAGPRIFVFVQPLEGAVRADDARLGARRVAAALKQMYPCATVTTEEQLAILAAADKRLKTNIASSSTDELYDIMHRMAADLVVSLTFGTTGTTHNSPARTMRTFAFTTSPVTSRASSVATGEGWSWSSGDLVQETIDGLRGLDLCPLLGTVEYTRSAKEDSTATTPVPQSDGSAQVEHFTSSSVIDESWVLALTRRRLNPVRTSVKSGHAREETRSETRNEHTNVRCMVRDASGATRDNNWVSGATEILTERSWFKGTAGDSLLVPKVTLLRDASDSTWTIAASGMVTGEAQARDEEEMSGGCGAYKREKPAAMPPMFWHQFTYTVTGAKEQAGVLSGSSKGAGLFGASETLTWNLSRK